METCYRPEGFTAEEAAAAVADLESADASISLNGDLKSVGCSLALESDTAINLTIRRAEGYTGGVSVTVDGISQTAKKLKDGRFKVTIPNIGAQRLGRRYSAVITTDTATEPAEISVTAMSYVRACLNKEELSEDERNAMMALYEYYREAELLIP